MSIPLLYPFEHIEDLAKEIKLTIIDEEGVLWYIETPPDIHFSFLAGKINKLEKATGLTEIKTIETFHLFSLKESFIPTAAEVIGQIPDTLINQVTAVRCIFDSITDLGGVAVHRGRVILYTKA